MSFYWIKTNSFIKKVFSSYVWDIPNNENKIYLTFDDGPTPEITEWVLAELQKHDAKATFFCIGKNIESHPTLFEKIITEEHAIGNHTYNHLNGWKTKTRSYLENIKQCEETIQKSKIQNPKSKIFRPPYGRITPLQSKKLQKLGYKIIMWDVLSADFDPKIDQNKCVENVLNNTTSGSIIVFHDSIKGFRNLQYALPKILTYLKGKKFVFEVIE